MNEDFAPLFNETSSTAMEIWPAPQRRTPSLLDRVDTPKSLRRLPLRDLPRFADALRQETIRAVAVTGGHLGSGLGVVELTVALHYVFDTPRDRLVWDVGHQVYPHKILTGRRDRIRTLRAKGGLSGFTRRAESVFDPFGAAHAGTSVSAAFGMAKARDLLGDDRHVVAVVGDGAMSSGMVFEALNNAGADSSRLLVVLNDNDMSIAPAVGALTNHFKRLKTQAAGGESVFGGLGFAYVGPIDGHDVIALVEALRRLRAGPPGPALLHVVTEKGKGYAPAEAAPDKYHGVVKYDVATGKQAKPSAETSPKAPSYTKIFGEALVGEAARDPRIVAITAAMPSGTGLDLFAQKFPERFFDVGIAEQHAVTFAAGLATEGFRPFCAIYSTFLQRAYDQVIHDVALQNLPVRFMLDRAGLVGADGPTHAGAFDIAFLTCLPNMVVMAAADEAELVHMVATAAALDDRPCALRYPRADGVGVALPDRGVALPLGKGRLVRRGERVALLSFGARLAACLTAADRLAERGLSVTVADARFAKPLDLDLIFGLADSHEGLITIEEGSSGGFGAAVASALMESGRLDGGVKLRAMVLPDLFQAQADMDSLYAEARLDAAAIFDRVSDLLARKAAPAPAPAPNDPRDRRAAAKADAPLRVLLAQPRGFCAGVVRAIEIVERALQKYENPVYVRHEIVHNQRVVAALKAKGAHFVEDLADVPDHAVVIFSAHGVPASVEREAARRPLAVLDATCPLVTRVHHEGRRHVAQGRRLIFIGHAGHPEVIGALGQIPGPVALVENAEDVARLDIPADAPVAYVTQTTLSVEDTRGLIDALRRRFHDLVGPGANDICYATQNRQAAARALCREVDALLVVGAANSSNANRLREIGADMGVRSFLVADADALRPEWIEGARAVGVTAGASAPEDLVLDVIERLAQMRPVAISTLGAAEEAVTFRLPAELR